MMTPVWIVDISEDVGNHNTEAGGYYQGAAAYFFALLIQSAIQGSHASHKVACAANPLQTTVCEGTLHTRRDRRDCIQWACNRCGTRGVIDQWQTWWKRSFVLARYLH